MELTVSETLDKAADIIEERGWWNGGDVASGPVGTCPANAITSLTGTLDTTVHYALVRYLGGESLGAIWRWNDAPGRTAAEVIEVLRACALIESAREEQDAAWQSYAPNVVTV